MCEWKAKQRSKRRKPSLHVKYRFGLRLFIPYRFYNKNVQKYNKTLENKNRIWTTSHQSFFVDGRIVCPTNFSVYVTCDRGSVVLWQKCNTLCTSGFVDDVVCAHNGQARRRRRQYCMRWMSLTRAAEIGSKFDVYDCLENIHFNWLLP